MKISKTIKWILTFGLIAIALVVAGVLYVNQQGSQSDLNGQVEQAEADYARYTLQKTDLESKLSQAELDIPYLEGKFFSSTESVEIEEDLYAAADIVEVTITSLTLSSPTSEELEGITYQVLSVDLAAVGEAEALLNFSYTLSYWFHSAAIERTNLSMGEGGEEPSLNMGLKIYTLEAEQQSNG
jgi:hypothetical protein